MTQGKHTPTGKAVRPRMNRLWCATLALATVILLMGTACDEEAAGRAFRDAAASSVQTGMKDITDGFIDGLFAVFELGDGQDATSDTTAATEGG